MSAIVDDTRFHADAEPHDNVTQRLTLREANDVRFAFAVDAHDNVTKHKACETASTMHDVLKNQRIFKIFENL